MRHTKGMAKKIANLILILSATILSAWFIAGYGKTDNTFYGDAQGYYMYLPATFIYHNLDSIAVLPEDRGIPSSVTWYAIGMNDPGRTPKGYVLNQYTYGVALMEMPFFFAAHCYEKWKGLGANGYSLPYEIAIKISSIIYTLLGLIITFSILRRFFSTRHAVISVTLLYIGTNLFWFTVYQAGMAHLPLFFLYALLIWLTIRLYEKPKPISFIAIGLVAGIITLIRPTDIICLLIPVLYKVYSKELLVQRWQFIKQHRNYMYLAAFVFLLPIIPQMLYWKMLTGSFLYYSYGGQQFFWSHPRILDGLFYFNNGWLPYSPIMAFSLIGFFMYKRIQNWAWCIWLLFPLYVYIIYSWYCFNYINGLGSRPMIHLYPLLAIPLCAFIAFISPKRVWVKSLVVLISLFFISLNISYSVQKVKGVLISEESNFAFNYQMLYRTTLQYKDLVVMDIGEKQPDETKLQKLATLRCENYEDSVSDRYIKDTTGKSRFIYFMAEDEHHPNTIAIKYSKQLFKDAKWFKCSGRFMYTNYPGAYYQHLLVLSVKQRNDYIKWKGLKINGKIGIADSTCGHEINFGHFDLNRWGYVYYFVRIPGDIEEGDLVELDLWNIGKQNIYIDDICLELYK
jgi:hypothetical protein